MSNRFDHNASDQLSITLLDNCAASADRHATSRRPLSIPESCEQLLNELFNPFSACARRIHPFGRGARLDPLEYLSSVLLEKLNEQGGRNRNTERARINLKRRTDSGTRALTKS
jgi:hypothetical protein